MQGQPITIRRLGPEDAELLDRACPGFEKPPDTTRVWALLSVRSNEMVVAIRDGRVIGYGAGTVVLHPAQASQFHVSALEVHPDHRRCGAGARMLAALIEAGGERGCAGTRLDVEGDDTAAQALCRALGGRMAGGHAAFIWG